MGKGPPSVTQHANSQSGGHPGSGGGLPGVDLWFGEPAGTGLRTQGAGATLSPAAGEKQVRPVPPSWGRVFRMANGDPHVVLSHSPEEPVRMGLSPVHRRQNQGPRGESTFPNTYSTYRGELGSEPCLPAWGRCATGSSPSCHPLLPPTIMGSEVLRATQRGARKCPWAGWLGGCGGEKSRLGQSLPSPSPSLSWRDASSSGHASAVAR